MKLANSPRWRQRRAQRREKARAAQPPIVSAAGQDAPTAPQLLKIIGKRIAALEADLQTATPGKRLALAREQRQWVESARRFLAGDLGDRRPPIVESTAPEFPPNTFDDEFDDEQ